MIIRFSKYEGAGNDFLLFDAREEETNPPMEFIKALCDRHKGVGGDGMMILDMSNQRGVDFRMRYYNADGLEGTMCGNGGRCITLFAHSLGIGGKSKTFEGIDGLHQARILSADENRGVVELGVIDVCEVKLLSSGDYLLYDGSNHVVRFVESVDTYDVDTIGRALRYDPQFDYLNGVNVNFVEVAGDGSFKIRTYERGVENETLACGTGAVASAIATRIHTGSQATEWKAQARGGELTVRFDVEGESFRNIVLTGPARKVFSGKLDTSNFR